MSDDPASIRVVGGTPSDEETAAVAAVFAHLLLEQAVSTAPLQEEPVGTAWQRSARGLRAPLPRGGTWLHH